MRARSVPEIANLVALLPIVSPYQEVAGFRLSIFPPFVVSKPIFTPPPFVDVAVLYVPPTVKPPFTSNLKSAAGVVPIPTLPLLSTRIRSVPAVDTATVSAAGKNKPALRSPVWAMDGAAAVPSAKDAWPVNAGPANAAFALSCVWMAEVTPSTKFNSAAVGRTAVPPTFHNPSDRFGLIAVVPSKRSSRLSKFVLILVPQVSSDAPTSGFVNPKVVVTVSAHMACLFSCM